MGALKELFDSISTLRSTTKEAASEFKKEAAKSAFYVAQKSMKKKREERLKALALKAKRFDQHEIIHWVDEKSTNQIKGLRIFTVEVDEKIKYRIKCSKRDKNLNFIEVIDCSTGYCVCTVIESSHLTRDIYTIYEMNKEKTAVITKDEGNAVYKMRFENGNFCTIEKTKEKENKILFLKRECARVVQEKLSPSKYACFLDFNKSVEDKYLLILMVIYNLK